MEGAARDVRSFIAQDLILIDENARGALHTRGRRVEDVREELDHGAAKDQAGQERNWRVIQTRQTNNYQEQIACSGRLSTITKPLAATLKSRFIRTREEEGGAYKPPDPAQEYSCVRSRNLHAINS